MPFYALIDSNVTVLRGQFPVQLWCQPSSTTKLLVDQIETHNKISLRYHKKQRDLFCGQVPVILHKSQVNLSV